MDITDGHGWSVVFDRTGNQRKPHFYLYVGSHSNLAFYEIELRHPIDWDNVTVYNPFGVNVTSECNINKSAIQVSGSILDDVGWWKFEIGSPNYVRSIATQKLDTGQWLDEMLFKSGNTTRASVELGAGTNTPSLVDNLTIRWFFPNGTVWSDEKIAGITGGEVNSSSRILGPLNTSVGIWTIVVDWTNGTEVAYDGVSFQVHHSSNLTPVFTTIVTKTGLVVTGAVEFVDSDNGENLFGEDVAIVGNWSGGPVNFGENTGKNRWEADFDTSLTGVGEQLVIVNASHPFYSNSTCQFIISVSSVTRLNSPNAPWTTTGWDTTAHLMFNYESYDYGTTAWSPVLNTTGDVSFWVNWTEGEWTVQEEATPGIYRISIDTGICLQIHGL